MFGMALLKVVPAHNEILDLFWTRNDNMTDSFKKTKQGETNEYIYTVSKQNKDIRQFQNIKQSRGERNH